MRVTVLIFLPIVGSLTGCGTITALGYEPFVRNLDGKSELAISTHPASAARDAFNIPYVYDRTVTDDQLYFRIHVRDAKKKFGPNPRVESILIHSFTYQFPGRDRVRLLSDYAGEFWMQDAAQYENRNLTTVPYQKDAVISVQIDLTLNGKRYAFKGEMPATKSTGYEPLYKELMR